jgi:serine/threonine protein kinase
MRKYRLISKRGEGTFSEVIKAQNTKTGEFYAIKCMKSAYKNAEQVRRKQGWLQLQLPFLSSYILLCLQPTRSTIYAKSKPLKG